MLLVHFIVTLATVEATSFGHKDEKIFLSFCIVLT